MGPTIIFLTGVEESNRPWFRARGVLSDGVGGLLLGHKSGPVPSRSPVGRGAQIDLLIDQQLGEEAAAVGPMGGTGPLGVTDNDRLCHKMLVV